MGKPLELTGQKFNRLTAIKPTDKRARSQIVWEWICDCGNIHYAGATSVRTGNTKSCGCLNLEKIRERNMANRTSMELKYGLLTPKQNLGLHDRYGKLRTKWLCECDCGGVIEVFENQLKNGDTASCGCLVSKGEALISKCLAEAGYAFVTQKTFDDLLSPKNSKLRYDFCVFEGDQILFLIEFDGRQHRTGPEATWSQSYSLEELQLYDNMKNAYAIKNNYLLYRVPSNAIKEINLSTILQDKFVVRE